MYVPQGNKLPASSNTTVDCLTPIIYIFFKIVVKHSSVKRCGLRSLSLGTCMFYIDYNLFSVT